MLASSASFTVLPAEDLARARDFYRDKIGITPFREDAESLIYGSVEAPDLMIYQTSNVGTAKNTQMCWVVTDISATMDELRSAGVTFEEYDFPGLTTVDGVAEMDGEYSSWFKDSEGNILCLAQPRT
jgi:predicted enzyme related to lactoylglutathione lyase